MGETYRRAAKKDAGVLVALYDAAFYADYVRYGTCPGYGKTAAEMEASLERAPKHIILENGVPVGVISAQDRGGGEYYLGCLCVVPEHQGKGIGTRAFRYLLSRLPDWKRITLVTPADKEENVRFYTEKCGFTMGPVKMDSRVPVATFCLERKEPS